MTIEYEALPLPEIYRRVLGGIPFQATEFSLSNTMMMRDRGDVDMAAVAVFPNRAFRHGTLVVAKESPLTDPRDLRGRRVGVVDYSMTAAVWLRGILADEYGVHWSEVQWVSGNRQRFAPPGSVGIQYDDRDLETMLTCGDIDALVSPRPRDARLPAAQRRLRPLLPEAHLIEEDYFRRTGLFPINHAIVLPGHMLDSYERVPEALQAAHLHALSNVPNSTNDMAFLPEHLVGWSQRNRFTVERLADYLLEQELVSDPVDVDAMFRI